MAQQKKVKLTIKGSLLAVTPVNPDVERVLVSVASFSRRQGSGGSKQEFETTYLCSTEEGYMLTFAGLYGKVLDCFQRCGYEVETDIMLQKKLVPDISKLSDEDMTSLREDQVTVIGLVSDHPGGFVIDAPTGWGKSYVIVQLCQIFPTHRIAVVAPGKEVTHMLYRRLKEKIRDVGQVGDGQRHIARITVCTMESLDKLRHHDWDLLLFDEVHRAGAPGAAGAISSVFSTAKCVGFSASPTGRSDGSDLVVEALFGPVLHRIQYQDGVDNGSVVPIKVRMYRINKGGAISTNWTVERNRYGLWNNEIRNSFIAKLAREIPEDDQVLIMASTAEHVLYLRQWLPNYDVVFSNVTNKQILSAIYKGDFGHIEGLESGGSISASRRGWMRSQFEQGIMKRVISTGIWNTGVDFGSLKWLIRADGMASDIQSIQTPGRLSRLGGGLKTHGNLIDFIDQFDPTLYRRSQDRMRRYKKNGWSVQEFRDPDVCTEAFSDLKRKQACQTSTP